MLTDLLDVLRVLFKYWSFSLAMALRDIKAVNKGAVFGIFWLVIRPLIQVLVLVVIVTQIFKVRSGVALDASEYGLHVLSGIIIWQALQRPLEEAPSLIRERMEILKQIVYPVITLPVTALVRGALAPAVGLSVYVLLAGFSGKLSWTIIFLPVPIILLFIMALGASWVMMIIGVVLKDLREIVAVLLGMLMYLSPVLLSEDMVGEKVWGYILLNPLAHIVIAFRDVLSGNLHILSWAIFILIAIGCFLIGAVLINKMKIAINEYI